MYISKKKCFYCTNDVKVDYKDINQLRRYISKNGKILPRKYTGLCAKHQRQAAKAIERARFLSLLPYAEEPSR
jgi:small subunit ribosomal protein S18